MSHVVRIDLSDQILTDFGNGLDLSPPEFKQGKDILSEYDEFQDETTPLPFMFEDGEYEED